MLFEFLIQGGFMILTQMMIPAVSFPAYIVLAIVVMSKMSSYPALGLFARVHYWFFFLAYSFGKQ